MGTLNFRIGMNTMHRHAYELAAMRICPGMLAMLTKSICISSPPVILVMGVLSDVGGIGTIVAPFGRQS